MLRGPSAAAAGGTPAFSAGLLVMGDDRPYGGGRGSPPPCSSGRGGVILTCGAARPRAPAFRIALGGLVALPLVAATAPFAAVLGRPLFTLAVALAGVVAPSQCVVAVVLVANYPLEHCGRARAELCRKMLRGFLTSFAAVVAIMSRVLVSSPPPIDGAPRGLFLTGQSPTVLRAHGKARASGRVAAPLGLVPFWARDHSRGDPPVVPVSPGRRCLERLRLASLVELVRRSPSPRQRRPGSPRRACRASPFFWLRLVLALTAPARPATLTPGGLFL